MDFSKLPLDIIKIFPSIISKIINESLPYIKSLILNEYDNKLIGAVHSHSDLHPSLFLGEFKRRLENFTFIDMHSSKLLINTPDMSNFDFSGALQPVRMMLEGVPGLYVEISKDDYVSMFGRAPKTVDSLQDMSDNNVYIIPHSDKIRNIEAALNKSLSIYPFSNMPPIDIFSICDKAVSDNMDKWVSQSVEVAVNSYSVRS